MTTGTRAYVMAWMHLILILSSSGSAFTTATQNPAAKLEMPTGGAAASVTGRQMNQTESSIGLPKVSSQTSISSYEKAQRQIQSLLSASVSSTAEGGQSRPLKILFLSADTGGGHRASAEALAKQFQLYYPGSTYDLLDVWTNDGVLPYRTLVNSYKRMSAHPWQWRVFYHLSNNLLNEVLSTAHATFMCEKKIRERIASYDPDVILSVHPTMNYTPLMSAKKISKALGKHIPFFTVVTDFGSGHCMWFQRKVDKMYIASERLRKIAKRRGTPEEKIFMTGLPIRHDFAVEAANMGCRTSPEGKEYQKKRKMDLGLSPDKKMVLVMGGGEGVGSLSDIVNELYVKFNKLGVDATICVVCGRNEKLKKNIEDRDWDAVLADSDKPKRKRKRVKQWLLRRRHRSRRVQESYNRAEHWDEAPKPSSPGNVSVVPLGFVTEMAAYMAAADILVSKAGPGTIAEAASVGLPVMLTSFLPGQESGNVDLVLENGFGDFNRDPDFIAREVAYWLKDEGLLHSMSVSAQQVGQPNAASEIVQDIGMITHTWMRLNGE